MKLTKELVETGVILTATDADGDTLEAQYVSAYGSVLVNSIRGGRYLGGGMTMRTDYFLGRFSHLEWTSR